MSTFDLKLLRLTADTTTDADPVAAQTMPATGVAMVKRETEIEKPMTIEILYYWVSGDTDADIVTGAGRGTADLHVVKQLQGSDGSTAMISEGPARTLLAGEPITVPNVLPGDLLSARFSATTPVAGATKIRVMYREQPEST